MINDYNATTHELEICLILKIIQNSEETQRNSSINSQSKVLKINVMPENYTGPLHYESN